MSEEIKYSLEECKQLARAEFDPDVDYLEVLKAMIKHVFDESEKKGNPR